jgi:hypothetical protein
LTYFFGSFALVLAAVFGLLAVGAIGAVGAGAISTVGLVWAVILSAIENRGQKAALYKWGRAGHLPYTATLDWVLRGLPKLLLPRRADEETTPNIGGLKQLVLRRRLRARDAADLQRLMANPWSWPVMDAALSVAIVYPIVLALTQFTLAGEATALGTYTLIPGDTPRWVAAVMIGAVAVLVTQLIRDAVQHGFLPQLPVDLLPVPLAGAVATVSAFEGASIGGIIVSLSVVTVSFFVFAGAGAGALVTATLVALACAAAAAAAAALAGAGAGAFAVAAAGALATAFAVVGWLAGRTRQGRGGGAYAVFTLGAVALAGAAAVVTTADSPATIWLLALALLPLINAPFDWASYGATMWLLSRGHRRGGWAPLASGLADAALAFLVIFPLLSLALVTALGLVDRLRDDALIDLGALLAGLQHAPGETWWIVAMVGSTLLPTLLHLGLAFVSLCTWLRATPWNALVRWLDHSASTAAQLAASLGLTLIAVLYVVLPVALIVATGWVIWAHGGVVREVYAQTLMWYAGATGLL